MTGVLGNGPVSSNPAIAGFDSNIVRTRPADLKHALAGEFDTSFHRYVTMRTPATYGVTLLRSGLNADIGYQLVGGILPLILRANYQVPRYVNRLPATQQVAVDQEVQLPYAQCRDWAAVDVGAITRPERILVSEPSELVGFFEPSLGKDARMWRNAFGDVFNGAELDAPYVNAIHSLSMTGRLLPNYYEPTMRLSTYLLDEILIGCNNWRNSVAAAPNIAQPVAVRITSQRAYGEITNRVTAGEVVIGLDVAVPISFNDWCPLCDIWYAVQVLFGSLPFAGTQDPAGGAVQNRRRRYQTAPGGADFSTMSANCNLDSLVPEVVICVKDAEFMRGLGIMGGAGQTWVLPAPQARGAGPFAANIPPVPQWRNYREILASTELITHALNIQHCDPGSMQVAIMRYFKHEKVADLDFTRNATNQAYYDGFLANSCFGYQSRIGISSNQMMVSYLTRYALPQATSCWHPIIAEENDALKAVFGISDAMQSCMRNAMWRSNFTSATVDTLNGLNVAAVPEDPGPPPLPAQPAIPSGFDISTVDQAMGTRPLAGSTKRDITGRPLNSGSTEFERVEDRGGNRVTVMVRKIRPLIVVMAKLWSLLTDTQLDVVALSAFCLDRYQRLNPGPGLSVEQTTGQSRLWFVGATSLRTRFQWLKVFDTSGLYSNANKVKLGKLYAPTRRDNTAPQFNIGLTMSDSDFRPHVTNVDLVFLTAYVYAAYGGVVPFGLIELRAKAGGQKPDVTNVQRTGRRVDGNIHGWLIEGQLMTYRDTYCYYYMLDMRQGFGNLGALGAEQHMEATSNTDSNLLNNSAEQEGVAQVSTDQVAGMDVPMLDLLEPAADDSKHPTEFRGTGKEHGGTYEDPSKSKKEGEHQPHPGGVREGQILLSARGAIAGAGNEDATGASSFQDGQSQSAHDDKIQGKGGGGKGSGDKS